MPVQVAGGAFGDSDMRFVVGDDQRAHVQQVGNQVHGIKGKLLGAVGPQQAEVVVGASPSAALAARQVAEFVEAEVLDLRVGQKSAGGSEQTSWPARVRCDRASWRSPFR